MKTREFYFDLPEHLIAQHPSGERGKDRLLVLDRASESISHREMEEFPSLIPEDSVLVLNNSRVRKIRLFGISENTGGRVEFFLIRETGEGTWECLTSKSRKQQPGKTFVFPENRKGIILSSMSDGHKILKFDLPVKEDYLERNGHIPLPPYIKRDDTAEDQERYQTVYAESPGSLAAPTAGLHFTENMLASLDKRGISIVRVTLHVGLGTFLPVRSENLEDHRMHYEDYDISEETAGTLNSAVKEGRPVMAVGTTSVRTLEASFEDGSFRSGTGSTNLFIYPGYRFKAVSHLLTNFHTPESSLLMLVSAFAGKENIDKAYREAIGKKYRFFSYGDAMLIL